jgi:hypothetical protein
MHFSSFQMIIKIVRLAHENKAGEQEHTAFSRGRTVLKSKQEEEFHKAGEGYPVPERSVHTPSTAKGN